MAMAEDRYQRVFDKLPNYRFHLMDMSFTTPVVLNLSYGFKSITAPGITLETKDITQGNQEYKRSVVLKASVEDITLEKGVSIFNSDFYDWVVQVIRGTPDQRRNLMLIQFSDTSMANGRVDLNLGGGPISVINFNDLVGRAPGRSWMLKECIPVAYKAGSDFDALGNEISLESLTIRPYYIEEMSFGL